MKSQTPMGGGGGEGCKTKKPPVWIFSGTTHFYLNYEVFENYQVFYVCAGIILQLIQDFSRNILCSNVQSYKEESECLLQIHKYRSTWHTVA